MLGDTEIVPPVANPEFPPAPQSITSTTPPPIVPVAPTYVPPRPRPSLLPILFGFLVVLVVAAGIGIAYYKTQLKASTLPSPTSSAIALASADPSMYPTSTPSATPKSSTTASAKPTIKPATSPTPTPVPAPSLDIRFGNPSANVKQTIDEGKGDGRVINREYSSIQVGEFDEVSTSWTPRVTVCFHVVSNEEILGKNLKYSFTLDDKVEVEDNFGQYDKMEAGRLYDWCHDVTTNIGSHTAKLLLNPDKSIKELNYVNDLARLDWKNLADQVAPNFTLTGPSDETATGDGTCFKAIYISDNVTSIADLKREIKQDGGNWQFIQADKYCLKGDKDSSHSMSFKITDTRGNANEQNKSFVLYWY